MQSVKIPVKCSGCGDENIVEINTWTGEHKVLNAPKPAGYGKMMAVVDRYKKMKGFDTMTTWDAHYKPRALRSAKQLLHFFRKLEDPVGVAVECLEEVGRDLGAKGLTWTLETVVTHAPEWLARKAK